MIDQEVKYRDLQTFAAEIGVAPSNLVKVFEIETGFHNEILRTTDHQKRQQLYRDLYDTVLPLLISPNESARARAIHTSLIKVFRRELVGKSVLDVGCGNGQFLALLDATIPHGGLCGLDTSYSDLHLEAFAQSVRFICQDITSFTLDKTFDVVFSNQVFEHIAPADVTDHLNSVYSALFPGGTFIILTPNRLWGPSDVTRIVDNTYTGCVPAQGSHINERSYTELLPLLLSHGFEHVRTILPFAVTVPLLGCVRVTPILNVCLERSSIMRRMTYLIKRHGKAIFKNPVVLVARRPARV